MGGTVQDARDDGGALQGRAVQSLALVLECDRPCAGGAAYSLERVAVATIGRGEARAASRRDVGGVVSLDVRVPSAAMSSSHARLVRAGDAWVVEDAGSTNGTHVNGAQVSRAVLSEGDVVTIGRALFLVTPPRITAIGAPDDAEAIPGPADRGHLTLDPELRASLDAASRIARSTLTVLVRGDTGTGKELLARAVHAESGRAGAFVPVNCGAIPANLVESHFFGHVRGAFSGAVRDEPGVFRAADGGTIFLDEIGDLPAPSQAALLRALQEREILPVGAARPVAIDVRVVAATHRPLEAMCDRGEFRRDLLARLAGFTIELPPLRARRVDLGVVAGALVRKLAGARAGAVKLTPNAAEALLRYDWPLNARELEQCLARALVLAGDDAIRLEHLPAEIARGKPASSDGPQPAPGLSERDQRLRLELLEHLARHEGNLADVARAMGKARMQVHRWCKRFGIDPNVYRR